MDYPRNCPWFDVEEFLKQLEELANNNSRAEKSGKDKARPGKENAGREDGGAKASLIGRLKEKQDMLSKAAGKDAPGLVKKPEMDMQ